MDRIFLKLGVNTVCIKSIATQGFSNSTDSLFRKADYRILGRLTVKKAIAIDYIKTVLAQTALQIYNIDVSGNVGDINIGVSPVWIRHRVEPGIRAF